jgi:hypothetical protein
MQINAQKAPLDEKIISHQFVSQFFYGWDTMPTAFGI